MRVWRRGGGHRRVRRRGIRWWWGKWQHKPKRLWVWRRGRIASWRYSRLTSLMMMRRAQPQVCRTAYCGRRESQERERQSRTSKEDVRLEQYLQAAQDDEVEYVKRQAEGQQRLMQRERVGMNRERLEVGIDKAVASIDLFRTGTPEIEARTSRCHWWFLINECCRWPVWWSIEFVVI